MRHFLDLLDLNPDELTHLLRETSRLKDAHRQGQRESLLANRVLGMIFEKPSLRTRASFEAAMAQMGGSAIFMNGSDAGMGKRESVPDFARTMSAYVDAVVLRTFSHQTIVEFARWSSVPVINGLSDYYHPCQALADLFTVWEVFGEVRGKTLVFVGDGNNVARSVAVCCGKLGAKFILAAPKGYGFDEPFVQTYQRVCPNGDMIVNGEPSHAVGEADVIYTDVWTSMGQEEEAEERRRHFADFQVNTAMLKLAPKHTRVMHCLPAHRGEEVTDEVLDGERSVVFQQAANRMHAQKALLKWLLEQK
jgi:ornithine carbamoyltransferase